MEQQGEFSVAGRIGDDVDLAFVTDLLGQELIVLHRQGEPLPHTGRPRPRSMWIWKTAEVIGPDSEAVMTEILDRFDPYTGTIADLSDRLGLEVRVCLIISLFGDLTREPDGTVDADVPTPGLLFSAETLRRVAALRASLWIDQYVIAPDPG